MLPVMRSYAPASPNCLPLSTSTRDLISRRTTRALSSEAVQLRNSSNEPTLRRRSMRGSIAWPAEQTGEGYGTDLGRTRGQIWRGHEFTRADKFFIPIIPRGFSPRGIIFSALGGRLNQQPSIDSLPIHIKTSALRKKIGRLSVRLFHGNGCHPGP